MAVSVLCVGVAAGVPVKSASAQEGGVTESFWRWGFFEFTAQRFVEHAFYRMTGNDGFSGGSINMTLDNWYYAADLGLAQYRWDGHEKAEAGLRDFMHKLPPTTLEYIMPTNIPLLTAISLTLGYTNTWLTDEAAKKNAADPKASLPIIRMRNHFYLLGFTGYLFGTPGPNNVEILYGAGFAHTETTIRTGFRPPFGATIPLTRSIEELDHYTTGSPPVFYRRAGIASSGENFGVVFETLVLNDTPIMKNPFWKSPYIKTRPLDKYIDVEGLLLRILFVYSFW